MSDHNDVIPDVERGYEENTIDLKLILYFTGGLTLLIVITFGLMWILQYWVLEDRWNSADEENRLPMALSAEERLPPEPRLQSAPGFGVDSPDGRIDLQLREPQAEYRELLKIWEEEWENGQKDERTGTVITLSIDEAKKQVLANGLIKARGEEESKAAMQEAGTFYSSSSSGRLASEVRR
ncbi:MAG: hypothetical protein DWQ47_01295 [Acidobacteria bacterium]|nr:MAG: hypothetical protein DWQ32_11755 [Acidobacteriota bacterium]REK04135.1 MAG: hypothetical protein DWQ38_01280 [Acidobacteriota bacterium]REK15297.1 MAG: hypothetical protein DWQ43_17445 [Acidobacteriota bacterium]REK46387.1 MAG: hypothetical protein DWQ47_01295 [Acidobacteriota bacterium]